jgi:1,4-dihydroxy-2-naphthoyl-CoA hydrolase
VNVFFVSIITGSLNKTLNLCHEFLHNKKLTIEHLKGWNKNTLGEHLGIQYTEPGDDYLKAIMPVDSRTHQPYGLLHGGASAVLAETLGSICSALVINGEKFICVGIEINANHIRV